jgi:hypothetical protein
VTVESEISRDARAQKRSRMMGRRRRKRRRKRAERVRW